MRRRGAARARGGFAELPPREREKNAEKRNIT